MHSFGVHAAMFVVQSAQGLFDGSLYDDIIADIPELHTSAPLSKVVKKERCGHTHTHATTLSSMCLLINVCVYAAELKNFVRPSRCLWMLPVF